jgi:hypothetical protein
LFLSNKNENTINIDQSSKSTYTLIIFSSNNLSYLPCSLQASLRDG